jgi:type VI protein secretion system component Hcp
MAVAAHYLELLDREGSRMDGESEGHDHEGQIDVTGWNWDVSDKSATKADAPRSSAGSGGASPTKAPAADTEEAGIEPSLFTFTKAVDASTTRLMKAMDSGEVLQRATFELVEDMVDVKNPFRLLVALEKIVVVGYRLGGRSTEYRVDLEETWELNYTTISFDYASAGGMSAVFNRSPGSTKKAASKSEPDNKEMHKRIADLEQTLAAAKGKRG